jgi:hypothetical protein
MTRRPVTDAQLTAGLLQHLPRADAGLRERILGDIATTPQERRLPVVLGRLTDADRGARRRMLLLVAGLALVLALSASAIVGALLRDQLAPELSREIPEIPEVLEVDEVVRGWPATDFNPPGAYAWGGRCAGQFCSSSFMHNGNGSGDVEIQVGVGPRLPVSLIDSTAVTFGGLDGTYRRVDADTEEWVADIHDDMAVSVRMTARPGTSQAELDEAHAIIDSMRVVRSDNAYGFSLIFRLTTDDWDSG